jgi:transposase
VHISAQTKFKVILPPEEKIALENLIHRGTTKARTITRARILLLAAEEKTDNTICNALSIVRSVVYDARKHYVEGGLKRALYDLPRPGKKRTLTGSQEAEVIAIACSKAPKGYVRWTLDLLTEEVKDKLKVSIGRTAIWKVLLRNDTKPWLKKNVVYSQSNRGI